MDPLEHTTVVPDDAYATHGGYPITREQYRFTLLLLREFDALVLDRIPIAFRKRLLDHLVSQFPIWYLVKMIALIRQLDVAKSCRNSRLIFTDKMSSPDNKSFGPTLLVPGIRNKPRWDSADFPWIKTLFEDNYAKIVQELGALKSPVNKTFGLEAWGTHVLFGGHIENEVVTQHCPFTTSLLKQVPRFYGLHTCVSTTRPGGFIHRHTGDGNRLIAALRNAYVRERYVVSPVRRGGVGRKFCGD